MKTLQYGLATILLTASLSVVAEPLKKDVIDHQQKQAHEEIDAAEKASPQSETRPAASTNHKKHSVESHKGSIIKDQKKAAENAITEAEAASPEVEGRPAATTNQKSVPVLAEHPQIEYQQKIWLRYRN